MTPRPVSWSRLKQRIHLARKKLLFLDFDGTLVSIKKTPDSVFLTQKATKILYRLINAEDYVVCIISGRSIRDLKKYFDRKRVVYIGNHGFEFKGSGISVPAAAKRAKKLRALIWLMAENLKEDFDHMPGIYIEYKIYTLSVHYRNLSKKYLPSFRKKLDNFKNKYAHLPLVWKTGKKVWSVHPKIEWDKGAAALYLCRHYPSAFPIAIGDDVTDEDMFKSLRHRGITIRAGFLRKSSAEYYLKSQTEVIKFLDQLVESSHQ